MKRGKFIRKWLANPQKQYNEQCRDEMRDDLDLVIQAAIEKSEQKQLIIKIMNDDAEDGLYQNETQSNTKDEVEKQMFDLVKYMDRLGYDLEIKFNKRNNTQNEQKSIDILPHYTLYGDGRLFNNKTNRFMTWKKNNNGYIVTQLWDGNKLTTVLQHRLLAQSFIPNPKCHMRVKHINGIKSDNRLENLEWGYQSKNKCS